MKHLNKNVSHGMDASFVIFIEKYKKFNNKKDYDIDFDRNVVYGFPCLNKVYKFSYTNSGFAVEIETI